MSTGNHTKRALEICRASFGSVTIIFTVLLQLQTWFFRINMEDCEGDRSFAKYTTFSIADESDDYRVMIVGYRGTAGNALLSSVGNPIRFVTGISVLCAMQNE